MDLSPDEADIQFHIEFTPETCLQRHIAYVITTIAMSFIKRKEILYTGDRFGVYYHNSLPPGMFRIDVNEKERRTWHGLEVGESLGTVMVPDEICAKWERRELFVGVNGDTPYFKVCFAVNIVTKELAKPSRFLRGKMLVIKNQVPIVAEIWKHFHVMLEEFSKMLYGPKELDEALAVIRGKYPANVDNETKVDLNFGNKAVARNHRSLYEYVLQLAETETNFISCFDRVCEQWQNLKERWQCEAVEAAIQAQRLTKISL
jgi:hypothetical protein